LRGKPWQSPILDNIDAIRQLMSPVVPKKKEIGFKVREKLSKYGKQAI
jgi:hypothetical protein